MELIVGIPRALLFYKYKDLWLQFFANLNIKTVISPKTNKEIIDKGSSYVVDEACLSLKIFMGHVDYLQNKCDYLFIPRVACLNKNEKMCTNFLALYDLVKNAFEDCKILMYNVDVENNEYEFDGFLKIGKTLGVSYFKTLRAYQNAKKYEKEKRRQKYLLETRKLRSPHLKILVVAHSYNLYDDFVGKSILEYLESQRIAAICSDITTGDKKVNTSISHSIYWTYNKELMKIIEDTLNHIDGIILISTFPCGPDSLCNELIIRKIKSKPILYLTCDNNASDTGIITRLESFIDILKYKKERSTNDQQYN